MKYRKLRIAWSVAWGVVAVLLCVLWVRSYWRREILVGHIQPFVARLNLSSDSGQLKYFGTGRIPASGFTVLSERHGEYREVKGAFDYNLVLGFGFKSYPSAVLIAVPHWFALTVCASIATLPWLRWRFSLRTLLIAITLVAVALGFVVWAVRS